MINDVNENIDYTPLGTGQTNFDLTILTANTAMQISQLGMTLPTVRVKTQAKDYRNNNDNSDIFLELVNTDALSALTALGYTPMLWVYLRGKKYRMKYYELQSESKNVLKKGYRHPSDALITRKTALYGGSITALRTEFNLPQIGNFNALPLSDIVGIGSREFAMQFYREKMVDVSDNSGAEINLTIEEFRANGADYKIRTLGNERYFLTPKHSGAKIKNFFKKTYFYQDTVRANKYQFNQRMDVYFAIAFEKDSQFIISDISNPLIIRPYLNEQIVFDGTNLFECYDFRFSI